MRESDLWELARQRASKRAPKPPCEPLTGAALCAVAALSVLAFFLGMADIPMRRFSTEALMTVSVAGLVAYGYFKFAEKRHTDAVLKEVANLRHDPNLTS